jgi:hypothetical protein
MPKHLVRLACVKHAASVRPEPGSNSPLNDCDQATPRQPGNQKPNHERYMAEIRWNQAPKNQAPTGVCTFNNALAFSTLLSSQETDAHLRRNLRSLPGQPLNLTLEFLSCQLRFRKLSGRLRSGRGGLSRHQGSASVSLVVTTDTRETFGSRFLGGSPGPGPPSGVPSPSGQDELYG